MRKLVICSILIAISILAGCSVYSTSVITGNKANEPLKDDQNVKVYLFSENVKNFEETGLIEVYVKDSVIVLIDEIVKSAKDEAREIGANCIILYRDFFNSGNVNCNPNRFVFRAGIER